MTALFTLIFLGVLSNAFTNILVPLRKINQPSDKATSQILKAVVNYEADDSPKPQEVLTWQKPVENYAVDAPSGSPQEIKVEPLSDTALRVTWRPPTRTNWNSKDIGYYVGYRQVNMDTPFEIQIVNLSTEENQKHLLDLHSLKPHTQYSVYGQTYNKAGSGPVTDEVEQSTAEHIPVQPPSDVSCTTLTSQVIRVSWVSPPQQSTKGVITGYKVVYTPTDFWNNDNTKEYKIPASTYTLLRGLTKFTNYTIQILATTSSGDDVPSEIIHCKTEQDLPDAPIEVTASATSSDVALVTWRQSTSTNKRYIIEFKESRGSWNQDVSRVSVPGNANKAEIVELSPGRAYNIRIFAENEIGISDSSEIMTISMAEKVPTGKPQEIKITPLSRTSLRITWKPPARNDWNSETIAYYLGYIETNSNMSYVYRITDFSAEEDKENSLELKNLKPLTEYDVIIQTFNKVGSGPKSDAVKQRTEIAIDQPPSDVRCTTLTPQIIRVSWVSPSLQASNDIITGYKVVYAPSEFWYDNNIREHKVVASTNTLLRGLTTFTNYTIQVLATASDENGVPSPEIHCQTEQDERLLP